MDQRGKQSQEVKVAQYPTSDKKKTEKTAGTSGDNQEKDNEKVI